MAAFDTSAHNVLSACGVLVEVYPLEVALARLVRTGPPLESLTRLAAIS
ncbi:MAG: hypothetical protein ACXVFH_17570 [Solirubrobacteraceae bacterium]